MTGDRPDANAAVEFYRRQSRRYAEVAHAFLQSVYVTSSHPTLTDDSVLLSMARRLAPGTRCLDAGCGAGARDVYTLWREGCDVCGIDVVEENIALAREMHPEIASRVVIAGYHQDGPRQVDMQSWNWKGLDVVNAHERDPDVYVEGLKEAVAAVEAGWLDPSPLYSHRLSLGELGQALELTRRRPEGFVKALVACH